MIETDKDLDKVDKNSIIVTNSVTPRFLSALYKAKGLITEEYSPTSHGYLYSNSLKLPGLGGVRDATILLKNGVKIELNSKNSEVTLI